MEKLINDFSFGLFFWQAIILGVLIFLLRKFAWKPILDAISERETSIENALAEAKIAREQLDQLKADTDKLAKEAREERDAILKEGREMKDKMIAEAKEDAKQEADSIITSAREAIENEKMAALTEIKNEVATISVEMTEKLLGKELNDKASQESFVNDLLAKIN